MKARLKQRGIAYTEVNKFESIPAAAKVIVVGPDALSPREATDPKWLALAAGGKRVLVLDQDNPLHYHRHPGRPGADRSYRPNRLLGEPRTPRLRRPWSARLLRPGRAIMSSIATPTASHAKGRDRWSSATRSCPDSPWPSAPSRTACSSSASWSSAASSAPTRWRSGCSTTCSTTAPPTVPPRRRRPWCCPTATAAETARRHRPEVPQAGSDSSAALADESERHRRRRRQPGEPEGAGRGARAPSRRSPPAAAG